MYDVTETETFCAVITGYLIKVSKLLIELAPIIEYLLPLTFTTLES